MRHVTARGAFQNQTQPHTEQTTHALDGQTCNPVLGCRPDARGQAFGLAHLHLCGDLHVHVAPSSAGGRPNCRSPRGASVAPLLGVSCLSLPAGRVVHVPLPAGQVAHAPLQARQVVCKTLSGELRATSGCAHLD
eukprot:3137529-Rhodomonas_salina.1